MSKVYFLGDTHFGHKNICKYRTMFANPEEHDAILYDNIMTTVSKRDTLWLLGDIAFTHEALELVKSIPCRKHLVLGNHDVNERGLKFEDLLGVYDKVSSLATYKKCWISHCPIHPQELRGRVANIHGHLHYKSVDDCRYINLSAEQINYRPISWGELETRINYLKGLHDYEK